MSDGTLICPRAVENGAALSMFKPPFNGEMVWRADNTCSYCGSLNPETFMARLEAGDVELVPTDKSYKVYVRNSGGADFQQRYRDCPTDEPRHGPEECLHWVTRTIDETKFYFQHLSKDQQARFIELYNERKIKMGYPGHFYTTPFFCKRDPAPVAQDDGA